MLREFGQRLPLVTRASTGILEASEGRLVAGRALGWRYIAVLPCEDDALAATRFALGDNRSAALAVIDEDRLTEQLLALHEQGVDLQGIGWTSEEIGAAVSSPPRRRSLYTGPIDARDVRSPGRLLTVGVRADCPAGRPGGTGPERPDDIRDAHEGRRSGPLRA